MGLGCFVLGCADLVRRFLFASLRRPQGRAPNGASSALCDTADQQLPPPCEQLHCGRTSQSHPSSSLPAMCIAACDVHRCRCGWSAVDALLRAGVPLSVQWPFLSWPSTGASLWLHCASMPCRSMLQWASIRRLRCPNCRPCRPPLSRQRPPHRSAPTLTLTAALSRVNQRSRLLRVPWRRYDFCFSLLARACCALPVGYPRIATLRGATVGRHVPHRLVWSQFELVP
jgi:hypothetical protein